MRRTNFCLDKLHIERALTLYIRDQISNEELGACTRVEISFDDPEMCALVTFELETQ